MRGSTWLFLLGLAVGATVTIALTRFKHDDGESDAHDIADRVSGHLEELEARLGAMASD